MLSLSNIASNIYVILLFFGVQLRRSDATHCNDEHDQRLEFSLVRQCQRSKQRVIYLENTQTLEECISVTRHKHGLAFNYAEYNRRKLGNQFEEEKNQSDPNAEHRFSVDVKKHRQHFWEEPEEFFNCHVLDCPENATFGQMASDSRFDYFSLYGEPTEMSNYTCAPEVGLFYLDTSPMAFVNATQACGNSTIFNGSLAHVASLERTKALSGMLAAYNDRSNLNNNRQYGDRAKPDIHFAWVGLSYNISRTKTRREFLNAQNESLNCFLYRAWAPGYPKQGKEFVNSSCVAITTQNSWITIGCDRKLPFICEIFTSKTVGQYNSFTEDNCWQSLQ